MPPRSYRAFVLPLLEGADVAVADGVGHPEERLIVGHEVHVIVAGQRLVHPVLKHLHEVLVGLEPEGGEGEGERGPGDRIKYFAMKRND